MKRFNFFTSNWSLKEIFFGNQVYRGEQWAYIGVVIKIRCIENAFISFLGSFISQQNLYACICQFNGFFFIPIPSSIFNISMTFFFILLPESRHFYTYIIFVTSFWKLIKNSVYIKSNVKLLKISWQVSMSF